MSVAKIIPAYIPPIQDQRKRLSLDISEFRERLAAIALSTRRTLTEAAICAIAEGLPEMERQARTSTHEQAKEKKFYLNSYLRELKMLGSLISREIEEIEEEGINCRVCSPCIYQEVYRLSVCIKAVEDLEITTQKNAPR